MLAYFHLALYTALPLPTIIDEYWIRSMIVFNAYIAQLSKWRAGFLMELQDLKFFVKIAKIIAEVESNFVNELKQRSNWK